jgi:hypothetical protein
MRIKALNRYFYIRTDVIISKEMYKIHVIYHNFLRLTKSNAITECNELIVIRHRILGVTVPLQLLITDT